LAGTDDCSEGLSAEHYISRSLLATLGSAVAIDGFPWVAPGKKQILSIDNLTAKILCSRHNSLQSPLDSEAGFFFGVLHGLQKDAPRKSLSRKRTKNLFSGETIELWMLKVAAGFYYSKIARDNGINLLNDFVFDVELLNTALFFNRWLPKSGLYVRTRVGDKILSESTLSIVPVVERGLKYFVGITVVLTGIEFQLLLDPRWTAPLSSVDGWFHRPSELCFHSQTRAHIVGLTWPVDTPERSIRFDFNRTTRDQENEVRVV
jgi:hypothetical protein